MHLGRGQSGTGDTHLLDGESAMLLRHLCRQAASAPELVQVLAADLEIEPNAALDSHVERALLKFKHLGLIEPGQP